MKQICDPTLVKLEGIIYLVCPFCAKLIEPTVEGDYVLYDCCLPIFVPNETISNAINRYKEGKPQ